MTSAYFKYRILTYVNTILKAKFLRIDQHSSGAGRNRALEQINGERVHDLQMHSLYCITKVVKYLHEQTE